MNTLSQSDSSERRRSLGLIEAVHATLAPLLHQYGFAVVLETPEVVQYDSSRVHVSLLHQPLSYELDVAISHKDHPDQRFSLQDMIDAAESKYHNECIFFQASTAERVQHCVSTITDLLRRHGDSMLRGDLGTFRQMADASKYRSHKLTNEVVNEPIRKAAELAWKNQDYVEVKQRYESITDALTEVEAKRLDFATRHLNNG